MARTIDAGLIAQLTAGTVYLGILAELDFAGGFVRLWTGTTSLSYDSKTWTGVGTLGTIDPPEETGDGSAQGFSMTLSGIPSSSIALALGEVYRGRSAKIWLGFFDATLATCLGTIGIASGRMDTLPITEAGETSSITITCESRLVDLERPRQRRLTDAEQQRRFAGDLGCQYVAGVTERPINWGLKPVANGP